ncbi:hypothetical protein Aaci_0306 [Alicyclobacillus acidocaldarius subsp. acidocaldarius DSM 446]|uniref:Uncharacterized protein n=1 Tax=Alicyclobacillus acidocaldarius subsp. acidocaldarius (strain ATCC 27009 / DSM 446 / BCRC 14685 / JCM 5260 / KCTC 1825 / NBRC 15652 / NCIMB 11725 / NRRL B-14509 / 104-IA) TaxID=521098 RepID=C8WRG0_ALIAD|nr:hypothetical protein Aaci_0306 [Alicyclobacillus acidocaldarius subsp. acidocaldarius DSM 446]
MFARGLGGRGLVARHSARPRSFRSRGFSLLWSMVLVVLLATIVTTLLVWSRYTLRVGGFTQIQDTQRAMTSQANLEQTALNAVSSVSTQASLPISVSQSLVPTVTAVTTSQLQTTLVNTVFPALQKQGLTVQSYSLYTTPASAVLQTQLSQVQSVLNAAVNSLNVILQTVVNDAVRLDFSGAISALNASFTAIQNVLFLNMIASALNALVSTTSGVQIPHAIVNVASANGNTIVLDISYAFQEYGPKSMPLTPANALSLLTSVQGIGTFVSSIPALLGSLITGSQLIIPLPDWALQVAVV